MSEGHDTRRASERHRGATFEGEPMRFNNFYGAKHNAHSRIILLDEYDKKKFLEELFKAPDPKRKHDWLSFKRSRALFDSFLGHGCGGFVDLLVSFGHARIDHLRWPSHPSLSFEEVAKANVSHVPKFSRRIAFYWERVKQSGAGRGQLLDLIMAGIKMREMMNEDENIECGSCGFWNTPDHEFCANCGGCLKHP